MRSCLQPPYGYIMKIGFYVSGSGRSPVLDYIDRLNASEQAPIIEALAEIERNGFKASKVRFRHIEGKLWEIKISNHRVFYILIQREEMYLLHAYKKQSQKLPLREKEVAVKRMKEILS